MTRLASSCIQHYLTKEIVIRCYKMRLLTVIKVEVMKSTNLKPSFTGKFHYAI